MRQFMPSLTRSRSSNALNISSSTSHFFRMVKIVLVPKPPRASCRKTRAACFLILGLRQALLAKVFPRLLFFAHALKSRVHGLFDHVPVNAFDLQIGDNALASEFLVVAPQRTKNKRRTANRSDTR